MNNRLGLTMAVVIVGAVGQCGSACSYAVEGLSDPRTVRELVEKRAWAEIRALADKLEMDWLTNPDLKYFREMAALCKAIHACPDIQPMEYICLQDLASRVLSKPLVSGPGFESEAWIRRCEIAYIFGFGPAFFDKMRPDVYAAFRARNASLLAMFCQQVRALYNKNYIPKKAFMNVFPPMNPDNGPSMAGMSPDGIKNPVAHKAYEDAIAENDNNIEEASKEQTFEDMVKKNAILVGIFLKALYDRDPQDAREYEAFRKMCFGEKEQAPP